VPCVLLNHGVCQHPCLPWALLLSASLKGIRVLCFNLLGAWSYSPIAEPCYDMVGSWVGCVCCRALAVLLRAVTCCAVLTRAGAHLALSFLHLWFALPSLCAALGVLYEVAGPVAYQQS
jgi:hypothetical protein